MADLRKEIKKKPNNKNDYLEKLHQIVKKTIKEEELIINNLLHPPKEILSSGQKASDQIAEFGGSWKFIILFAVFFAGWILINIIALFSTPFDPYPFILMNLILSLIAALQAPVILMSQNRHNEKDRKRDENDYMINLKAEMEIRRLHEKMDLLLEKQIKALFESQETQSAMLKSIISQNKKYKG